MSAADLVEHVEAARRLEARLMLRGIIVLYADGEVPRLILRGTGGVKLSENETRKLREHIAGFKWLAAQRARS